VNSAADDACAGLGRVDPAASARSDRRAHLRSILVRRDFRRLFATRIASQCADGVFQVSLAGAVLFNPDHATDPTAVAAGFAVLLLPYSFVGPFAGIVLDRWSRRQILTFANVIRSVLVVIVAGEIAGGLSGPAFYASALVTISVNRFFLSGLSAALPHVVRDDQLVTANAFSTTFGTGATTIGAGVAVLIRTAVGSGDHSYAVIAASAAIGYGGSAIAARGFHRGQLGPDDTERVRRESAGEVLRGFVAGARHVAGRRPAAYALAAIGAHRLCYGVLTIMTLLLYRNYFHGHGAFRAGLAGAGQAVVVGAVGSLLAALVTPAMSRRIGKPAWMVVLLAGAGIAQLAFGLPFTMQALLPGAFLLGLAAQGVKICVDTTVQEHVDDGFRGRVFSVYDTLFNVTFVAAALIAAAALPDTGRSPAVVFAMSTGYLLTAACFGAVTTRSRRPVRAEVPG